MFECLWCRNVVSWFRNLHRRLFVRIKSLSVCRRPVVNLQIVVPDDILSDWTFPSPRDAQKQRSFAGAHPFDASVCVLPYRTKIGEFSPSRWQSIRTPVHNGYFRSFRSYGGAYRERRVDNGSTIRDGRSLHNASLLKRWVHCQSSTETTPCK